MCRTAGTAAVGCTRPPWLIGRCDTAWMRSSAVGRQCFAGPAAVTSNGLHVTVCAYLSQQCCLNSCCCFLSQSSSSSCCRLAGAGLLSPSRAHGESCLRASVLHAQAKKPAFHLILFLTFAVPHALSRDSFNCLMPELIFCLSAPLMCFTLPVQHQFMLMSRL